MSTKNINAWDWDVRVRERNLKNGVLTDKDIEKQVSALHDLEAQCEPVTLPQPALGGREDSDA
jgi:flagellar biosynthesis/type III secretory pathway chaperone